MVEDAFGEPLSRSPDAGYAGSPAEVFGAFLKLGLTSFGGPVAHLGYFRNELVTRRGWIDDEGYADLVALCQFLPGPGSSKVGFALGLLRAGPLGALAAWTAFTLPSAVLLVCFAFGSKYLTGRLGAGLVHGLKLVAVAIVAQAVWGMARTLAPDRSRATIAVGAVLVVVSLAGSFGQVAAIGVGALAGVFVCGDATTSAAPRSAHRVSRPVAFAFLVMFLALLLVLPPVSAGANLQSLRLFASFFHAGALVFGGGHVVLPMLQTEVVRPGWISSDAFLTGYGVAQAIPGPLFTFAAYLGAIMEPRPNGVLGAAICLVAIFLPGMLLTVGALPFWNALSASHVGRAMIRGANASVVGVLGAALYSPVWTSAILGARDFALALVGLALLLVWKAPPWAVVVLLAACGVGFGS